MTTGGEPRRLALEVRFDADPIEGRLYDDGRVDRPFSGWLGLMAAIEAARSAHLATAPEDNGEGS
jgi:hypothetical protein